MKKFRKCRNCDYFKRTAYYWLCQFDDTPILLMKTARKCFMYKKWWKKK